MSYSSVDIFKAAFVGVIFVLTIVGNSLVAWVLIKCRRYLLRNRPTYQFILNIVLSDLTVGLLTMPFEFVRELLGKWVFGTVLCKIVEFIEIAVSGTAVITHALISFDRYRSVARPYLPKLRARQIKRMITLSWLLPAFAASPYLYMFQIDEIDSKIICTPKAIPIPWLDKMYQAVEMSLILLLPFLIMCWHYSLVALTMWGISPTVAAENFSNSARRSVVYRNKKRVTRTSGLVAITFIVCWFPTFVLSFVRISSGTEHVHRGQLLQEVAMFGTFINEAINPVIYCAFDRNIKSQVRLRAFCTHNTDSVVTSNDDDHTRHTVETDHRRKSTILETLDLTKSSNRTIQI